MFFFQQQQFFLTFNNFHICVFLLGNYGATAKAKQKELNESYKKNFGFNKEEEKIADEKTKNEMKVSKLILLESQNQEKIEKRNQMIVETAQTAEINDITEVVTDEDAEKGVAKITEKLDALKKDLNEHKKVSDAEEKKLQLVVDESRDALSRHKQKISNKESEIQKNKKDIVKVEKEINDANESKVKLENLEKKIETADEEYKQLESELNSEECQQEINEDEKVMETYENELEQLSEKITKLQKQSAKLKEKDLIEESLKTKEKQAAVLKNKHKAALTDILGSMPEKDFAVSVNKFECEIRAEVDSMKKKQKEKHTKQTSLQTERKHVREMLTEKRSELTKAEDQMYKACGTQSFDSTLAKVTSTVEKLQVCNLRRNFRIIIFSKFIVLVRFHVNNVS